MPCMYIMKIIPIANKHRMFCLLLGGEQVKQPLENVVMHKADHTGASTAQTERLITCIYAGIRPAGKHIWWLLGQQENIYGGV